MKNTLLILLLCTSLLGQDTIKLKEVQVVYQANKKTPVSFQNLKTPELRLFGQEPSAVVFIKTTYPLGDFSLFSEIQYRYTDFNYEGSVSLSQLDWSFLNSKAGITYSLEGNYIANGTKDFLKNTSKT